VAWTLTCLVMILVSLGMVQLLGFLVGAGISWSNRLVGAGDSMECCPVGAGYPLSCCLVGAGCSLL
jgi:hypothetical protein